MIKTEIWKPIKGFETYLVSNFGNVKSLPKARKHVSRNHHQETFFTTKERILKRSKRCLWISSCKTEKRRRIHAVQNPYSGR